ncbi:MAG: response regulator [Ignavibacteriales bacterium]|nr:MAG: response regulator [Ignavibacteriales bacterium]
MNDTGTKYFQELYGQLHFPVVVLSTAGEIVYVNDEYIAFWGYTVDDLKNYSVFDDSELRKNGVLGIIQKVIEEKTKFRVDNYSDSLLRSKEITIPVFRTEIFPIFIENQFYIVITHDDQTEMYLTEQEVMKARDGNRESERLKNTFLNVLSHELRTPLNIILGYSSIIKENLKDKISSEDKVYLDNLYSGSERLFKSITQMLEFAQIEAGNYNLKIETRDLINILENSLKQIEKIAATKKIELKKNYKNLQAIVDVDVHCVENAIDNLLSNAVKFTQQGYIEVETEVFEDRGIAVCKIKDTGIGISSKYLDHLFQPFSQEDLDIGRNFEGNGLGLALSKRYFEKMGGSLLVDSIKGVGSTFTFTLPLTSTAVREESTIRIQQNTEMKKILMLDDSSESYELLNAYLKRTHIIEAHNFREFKLEYISKEDYHVIIFDVNQNHWEQSLIICRDLKKHDPLKRPVVILSSEFMDDKIKQFYEAGADKFIVKPFAKNVLLTTLESVTR